MEIEGSSLQDWTNAVDTKYSLRLYVAGASSMSIRAIKNLQAILENNLKEKFELEIIDIHQQPLMLQQEDIFAVPLLIKRSPAPVRRLVGDMSDVNKVLRGLGLN